MHFDRMRDALEQAERCIAGATLEKSALDIRCSPSGVSTEIQAVPSPQAGRLFVYAKLKATRTSS